MLNQFRQQKKVILALELERMEAELSLNFVKRARIETLSEDLPKINKSDFDFLRQVCSILNIFDIRTKKVVFNFDLKMWNYLSSQARFLQHQQLSQL